MTRQLESECFNRTSDASDAENDPSEQCTTIGVARQLEYESLNLSSDAENDISEHYTTDGDIALQEILQEIRNEPDSNANPVNGPVKTVTARDRSVSASTPSASTEMSKRQNTNSKLGVPGSASESGTTRALGGKSGVMRERVLEINSESPRRTVAPPRRTFAPSHKTLATPRRSSEIENVLNENDDDDYDDRRSVQNEAQNKSTRALGGKQGVKRTRALEKNTDSTRHTFAPPRRTYAPPSRKSASPHRSSEIQYVSNINQLFNDGGDEDLRSVLNEASNNKGGKQKRDRSNLRHVSFNLNLNFSFDTLADFCLALASLSA